MYVQVLNSFDAIKMEWNITIDSWAGGCLAGDPHCCSLYPAGCGSKWCHHRRIALLIYIFAWFFLYNRIKLSIFIYVNVLAPTWNQTRTHRIWWIFHSQAALFLFYWIPLKNGFVKVVSTLTNLNWICCRYSYLIMLSGSVKLYRCINSVHLSCCSQTQHPPVRSEEEPNRAYRSQTSLCATESDEAGALKPSFNFAVSVFTL